MWIHLMFFSFMGQAEPYFHRDCQLYVSDDRSWKHEMPLLEDAGYTVHRRQNMDFEGFPDGALILESAIEDGRCGVFCLKGVVTYHLYQIRKDEEPHLIKRVKKASLVPLGQGSKLVDMLKKAVRELPQCVVRDDPEDPIGKPDGET